MRTLTSLLVIIGVLCALPFATVEAASISQTIAMPVTNQTVTFTPPTATLSITGPQGYSQQFTTNSQGKVNWTPPRYGKYTLTSGTATQTMWVTVKPMIFHWSYGKNMPTNATIVQVESDQSLAPYWRSRGVKWEAAVQGTATYSYTLVSQWLSVWNFALSYDGLAIDETGEYGGASYPQYDAEVQAVNQVAQSKGPSYSLGLWVADIHAPTEFSASAAILTNIPSAYCMLESYWISYSTHQLAWSMVNWYPLGYKTLWSVGPYAWASDATRGPTTAAEVREEFRQYRLIGPEAPGVAVYNSSYDHQTWTTLVGTNLDAACDQAIEDFYLKPVISLAVSNGALSASNIGNDDPQGFSVVYRNGLGATVQSMSLSNITPNTTQTLSIPGNAVSLLLTNPAGTVNLYSDTGGVLPIPGRYYFSNASSNNQWNTSGNWTPAGPPPGNLNSTNSTAVFDNTATSVTAPSGETSLVGVGFFTADWTIAGSATAQDFYTYGITSAGAGTNTINIGVSATAAAPAQFTVNTGNTVVVNGLVGAVRNDGGLNKLGAGTLTLTYANTYTGTTSVAEGTLLVNGSLVSPVTVAASGTLGGSGTLKGAVTVNGTLAPGNSPGTLTVSNNLVLNGAVLAYELGINSDRVAVNGNLTLGGTLNVTDAGGFTNTTYPLITYTGTLVNNGLTVNPLPNGLSGTISNNTSSTPKRILLVVNAAGPAAGSFPAWQLNYFYCTNCPQSSATADFTGTGMSNSNKFQVGFNPTNSAAYVHIISVVTTGSDISITYLGANGDTNYPGGPVSRTNVLEYTNGTVNGSYSTGGFLPTGQTNVLSGGTGLGMITSMVDYGGATNSPSRYYRVSVLLP